MLEDLLTLSDKESSDFLDSCLLFKKFCVLELGTVVRVVAHEVFGQENAWIETTTDAWVDFIYVDIEK